jgi:hypothetical protein
MDDLIAFTEEHFAHLLPFTTLGRAGENDGRRQRRLVALMKTLCPVATWSRCGGPISVRLSC